jgi:hypothetical protein
VATFASVKIVHKMKRGMVGTTVRRFLSAARISSYVGRGSVGGGRGGSMRGADGGGRSASVICWQRGHGASIAGVVDLVVGGFLMT